MEFEAFAVLTPEAVKRLPRDVKVIGTRWVHTDKNAKQRAAGGRFRDIPVLAQRRLVAQGCQEYTYIRSDSPTASLLVVNLLCSVAAAKRWLICSADASNAYLQSDGIERLIRAPQPAPPGVPEGALMRARGSIHGKRDAGRGW